MVTPPASRPFSERAIKVTGYVLKRASSDVEAVVEKNIDEAIDVLPILIDDGINAAMKKLHTKESKED